MRKELKKKKALKLKTKKILKKYPWLKPTSYCNDWFDDEYDYTFTYADEIPRGWLKAFGWDMIDEIDKVLKKTHSEIRIDQIKEKYGSLRFYCSAPKEVYDILRDYEYISENVCITCGKPDVPMITSGWICPQCEKCFCKKTKYRNHTHEEFMEYYNKNEHTIPDTYTVKSYSKDEGEKTFTIDISKKVEKIRNKYK